MILPHAADEAAADARFAEWMRLNFPELAAPVGVLVEQLGSPFVEPR
jgi:hypothetical protein